MFPRNTIDNLVVVSEAKGGSLKKLVFTYWFLATDLLEVVTEYVQCDVASSRSGKQKFCSYLTLAMVYLLEHCIACVCSKFVISWLNLGLTHQAHQEVIE